MARIRTKTARCEWCARRRLAKFMVRYETGVSCKDETDCCRAAGKPRRRRTGLPNGARIEARVPGIEAGRLLGHWEWHRGTVVDYDAADQRYTLMLDNHATYNRVTAERVRRISLLDLMAEAACDD